MMTMTILMIISMIMKLVMTRDFYNHEDIGDNYGHDHHNYHNVDDHYEDPDTFDLVHDNIRYILEFVVMRKKMLMMMFNLTMIITLNKTVTEGQHWLTV